MHILLIFYACWLVFGLVLLYGSIKKNRWGVNLSKVNCPDCKTELPVVRKARNLAQVLWGGWTCSGCKAEIDKWGRRLNLSHTN